jgi:hypothetical protein
MKNNAKKLDVLLYIKEIINIDAQGKETKRGVIELEPLSKTDLRAIERLSIQYKKFKLSKNGVNFALITPASKFFDSTPLESVCWF